MAQQNPWLKKTKSVLIRAIRGPIFFNQANRREAGCRVRAKEELTTDYTDFHGLICERAAARERSCLMCQKHLKYPFASRSASSVYLQYRRVSMTLQPEQATLLLQQALGTLMREH